MKRCPVREVAWTLSEVIFDLPKVHALIQSLEKEAESAEFWTNPAEAGRKQRRLSQLKAIAAPFAALQKTERDIAEFYDLLQAEPNEELERETDAMALAFLAELDRYELQTLLSGEHDGRNALMEINAGAGGTEACDWAQMLLRMYLRWAEENDYKVEILSETPGDVTGYRSVYLEISGPNAYGYLKAENGVHRLVRISPFDAAARRHTSFAKVEVLPEMDETEVSINPDDLRIDTLRSSGAGGQHVNKTESAVRITHLPTGITVLCQNERSQHKNRASAMTVLAARLAELERAESEERRKALKGDSGPAEWGRQIRSYVLQPYTMVKDHRTGHETGDATGVLNGNIDGFIEAFLRKPPTEDAYVE